MKTLYVLRHAKSGWADNLQADFDRPLNQRGLNAAPFVGEVMAKRDALPDIVISSPARRAMQTAALFKESAGSNAEIKYDERIYEASVHALEIVVSQIDDKFESALIVGHNPGMEGLINYLTGTQEAMPTSALASINLVIDEWKEVKVRCGKLQFIMRPGEEMKVLRKLDS